MTANWDLILRGCGFHPQDRNDLRQFLVYAGKNVGRGKDDTLFSLIEGFVKFENKGQKGKFISVYALGATELELKAV